MQVLYPNCAGLDVHKKFVMATRRHVDETGRTQKVTRRFGTMTRDLEALAAWLAEGGCTHVAMESTGVYWQPVYNLLSGRFEVWLVNAQHVKHVPGRKTDVADSDWLAQLLQHGLLKPCYIPDEVQRDLRDLVRYRQHLVEERTRTANRLQKVLEDANLKLTSVASDIQGTSAQAILRAMLAGNEDPEQLANLARGQLRLKRQALVAALEGRMRPHHRFMLAQVLGHLDVLEQEIAALEAEIEARLTEMPAFAEAVERLDTIPGVSRQAALIIVAEIGVDMSRFPSDRHLTSWAGMAPGNNESGGKKRVAKTPKGNRYLRRTLVQAAWAAARTRNTYLRAMYHRLAARRGKHRAAVAVGRTILQIAYHLIQREEVYHDLGDDYFDRLDRERTVKRLTQRLETLGYEVHPKEGSLPPAA